MKKATIKDVAALAKVSVATVSRVINGNSRVNSELRARIEAAVKTLNYSPSAAARSMRNGGSALRIGLIIPSIRDVYYGRIVDNIIETADQYDQHVLINTVRLYSKNQRYDDMARMEIMAQEKLDGIIYFPCGEVNKSLVERYFPQIPIVIGGRSQVIPGYVHVYADYCQGGYIATQYLLRMGHRKIACLVGLWSSVVETVDQLDDYYYENKCAGAYPGIEQYIGYRHALEDAGVPYDPELIKLVLYDDAIEEGYVAAQKLLAHKLDIDAIVAANDLSAAGVIRFMHEQRISVPETISVVGWDCSNIAEVLQPRLTSIDNGMNSLGGICLNTLNKMIAGEPCENVRLEMKLVIGQSSCNHK